MASDRNSGGPAFPLSVPVNFQFANEGMTLRDWFAGQALASITLRRWDGEGQEVIEAWARCAYATADAMLAIRGAPDEH